MDDLHMLRALLGPGLAAPAEGDAPASPALRLRRMLAQHHADVFRVVRRLGVPASSAEDAAQKVFVVAASRVGSIEPGKERAFLLATAARVAANHRRSATVRHELADDEAARAGVDTSPPQDALLDEKRMRALLDEVLASLPEELRSVLVLFEIEELSVTEIAEGLGIARGTAASRLRRAREAFTVAARRARARLSFSEESA